MAKWCLVSTLEDRNGTWVRLFDSKEVAEKAARKYIEEECECAAKEIDAKLSDEDFLHELCDFLGFTEWFFVIQVTE